MRPSNWRVSWTIGVLLLVPSARAADTLVTKGADGKIQAGVATTWKADGNTVVFSIPDPATAAQVATTLSERLAGAKVTHEQGTVTVSGIPPETLLDQLAGLPLSGEADPLADLAGLEGVIAMSTPEAGGSIRASNPGASSAIRIKDHDPDERFSADVLAVNRGAFPIVSLKVKIRKSPKKGDLLKSLRRGKVVEAVVLLDTSAESIDFRGASTQRNLVGLYLRKGDRVTLHAIPGKGSAMVFDFVERTK